MFFSVVTNRRIPVVELENVTINSILMLIDKINTAFLTKPCEKSMFQGIEELYIVTNSPLSKDLEEDWKKHIKNCQDFSAFWKIVKEFLYSIHNHSYTFNINRTLQCA